MAIKAGKSLTLKLPLEMNMKYVPKIVGGHVKQKDPQHKPFGEAKADGSSKNSSIPLQTLHIAGNKHM